MTIKLGVVMDPIEEIYFKKDTTLAMLLEAEKRGWEIYYMEQRDLFCRDATAFGRMRRLHVYNDPQKWFSFHEEITQELERLDVMLMRKDPPFDLEYVYTTYLLELAEAKGLLVVNKPQSLRDANEKMFTQLFPQCLPPTLVTREAELIKEFIATERNVILKPLDSMGGQKIFHLTRTDPNINVVIETLTHHGKSFIMAQQYIPEIREGDKRIILINGEPVPYALARIPMLGETRGNLAVGGTGVGVELTEHDRWICEQVGPTLKEKGLVFVGLDVIGNYLTEINVTSPTCVREIDHAFNINISATFLNCVESLM